MRFMHKFAVALVLALALAAPALAQEVAIDDSGDFLFEHEESFLEPGGESGPWVYRTNDMTITVSRCIWTDSKNRRYSMADIRLRNGAGFYSGAAYQQEGTDRREMPHSIARRYGAVLGFTGDFLRYFDNPKGVMIRQGKVYYESKAMDTMAFLPDGTMEVYLAGTVTAQELLNKGVVNSYAFGPVIVKDGQYNQLAKRHFTSPANRRCAIGMVDKTHFIVVTTTDQFPIEIMGELFLSLGCNTAYNMDGGHSSSMILMGEQLNAQPYESGLKTFQRAIPDMILLGSSDEVPKLGDPVRYKNVRLGGIPKTE